MEPYPPRASTDRNVALRRARRTALAAALVAVAAAGLALDLSLRGLGTAALRAAPPAPARSATPPGDRLVLSPVPFAALPRWREEDPAGAVPPLLASCPRLESGADGDEIAGVAAPRAAWREVCAEARRLPRGDSAAARAFFERRFSPYAMRNNGRAGAFFTGYYAPELHGARRKTDRFRYPLYLRPRDLVTVDLGEFKRDLAGRRIGGRIAGGAFRPYFDRTAIDDGALAMRGLELLWVDDPLALFFLQIQGSGTVILPDGSRVRVGYAADNGFDYTPIGRVLVARGALPADGVSLQSIRDWLRAHPEEARGVMDQDESYVFFRVLPGDVVGSLGVPLTPGRSIAVDPKFVPLGLPLYAATLLPALPETGERATLFGRVFVAEDTGGAIKGPLRADLFWGSGPRAEALAGRMRQPGRLYLLLPRGH